MFECGNLVTIYSIMSAQTPVAAAVSGDQVKVYNSKGSLLRTIYCKGAVSAVVQGNQIVVTDKTQLRIFNSRGSLQSTTPL